MWEQSAERIEEVLRRYPTPNGVTFSYGTAGFRTTGSLLVSVGCRMAFVCALRSIVSGGKSTGLMITASHNPAVDNGVKIVDTNGCMLSRDWEAYATQIANASTAEELMTATASFIEQQSLTVSGARARVHVARDTRVTGIAILESFTAGCGALVDVEAQPSVEVVDHGITTTPQLHTMVLLNNTGEEHPITELYYSRIARAFTSLAVRGHRQRVVVDCGNGVGTIALRSLIAKHPEIEEFVTFVLINDSIEIQELLNEKCGADFTQKTKVVPSAFFEEAAKDPSALFVSFDGDADRVVAFHVDTTDHTAALLDGDRIAILLTTLIRSVFGEAADALSKLDVGIVQTAYANGASTSFVEKTLRLRSYCAATGVKYLHPVAEARDIGVYFEANGHGTVLFHEKSLDSELAAFPQARNELAMLAQLLSQVCGDALGDTLAVVVALQRLGWSSAEWLSMYTDLPSAQLKVVVPFPQKIQCTPDERRALAPEGLQNEIDEAVARCGDSSARCFVRPSGTEPLVRVYAEASTKAMVDSLSAEVEMLVQKYCSA
jgi:phosphoacetylglucosamine mutase